ncbi:HPr family phosphocarrier protein [Caproicibacter fermentans]|uniref:HPr family phosphocarrier protein n=1 Tax=Caproicibacter fermentans TaxID=2576756 RepID=A0A7G8T661_9FIRM|nr:HPr family phosphocarrier protein [Caproicibacter fermentans]QNK39102.1 HPr family phosphocarrier protein [Caproicibacter fermentans]
MEQFRYTIKDENGIHARPAGLLVKCAKGFQSVVTIECGSNKAPLSKLFALMGMNIKQGDTVSVTAEGPDEAAAIQAVQDTIEKNA